MPTRRELLRTATVGPTALPVLAAVGSASVPAPQTATTATSSARDAFLGESVSSRGSIESQLA